MQMCTSWPDMATPTYGHSLQFLPPCVFFLPTTGQLCPVTHDTADACNGTPPGSPTRLPGLSGTAAAPGTVLQLNLGALCDGHKDSAVVMEDGICLKLQAMSSAFSQAICQICLSMGT
jgi:hypothetical protein